METSIYNSYQQGGEGSIFTSWFLIAIVFWVLAIYLWGYYYFGFENKNKNKLGYVKDNEHSIRGTQTAIFFFVTGLAILLAYTGKWQNQVNDNSDLRKYLVIPLCWLTLGFQIGLISSISLIE
jgi:hypothetical protein